MALSEVVVGDGVSVLHSDGHRYECKVKKVEDTRIFLHWHGYGKLSDFWVDLDSDELGPVENASIPPPPPVKSLKAGGRRPKPAVLTDDRETETDSTAEQSSSCTRCSSDVMKDHLKCDNCGKFTHLSCSSLPDYMLIRFLKSETGYMCETCVKARWSSDKLFDTQNLIRNTKQSEKESKKQVADSKRTAPLTGTPISPPKEIPICQRFRRGVCPHGMKGKKLVDGRKCAYAHPPKCRKFCSAGDDKRYGCRGGRKCKFLHPILCPSTGRGDGVCKGESCKLTHIKGVKHGNKVPTSTSGGSQLRADIAASNGNGSGNSNSKASAAPSKNDQLGRIEEMLHSMKVTYDDELKALRQELVQSRGPPMPWMVPSYPWMGPPFGSMNPTSLQQQVPTSYRMQHSSL